MWYRTATKEVHTGVMIAFYVPSAVAKQIKLNKKDIGSNSRIESARELHMTLAFLGDKTGISDKKPDIINALKTFAKKSHTISGKISGVGLFSNQESDGNRAFYASFDSPELPEFRQKLVETINGIEGVKVADNHGFSPHITLAYINPDDSIPDINMPLRDVTFDKIVLAWAGTQEDIPLS